MKKIIYFSLSLAVLAVAFSFMSRDDRAETVDFCESFNYSDLKGLLASKNFKFERMLPQDVDGDSTISENEKVKEAVIGVDEATGNKYLSLRFKNNNFPKEKQSSKKGGYGNYLRRCEIIFDKAVAVNDEVTLTYKVNLNQFIFDNECYREDKDIITQFLIKNPPSKSKTKKAGDELIREPVLALGVVGDKWTIYMTNYTKKEKKTICLDGTVEKNKWVKFTINFKLSATDKGHLKISKDDELVYEKKGYSTSPEEGLEYTVKYGVYKPTVNSCKRPAMKHDDRATDRVLFFDDVCYKIESKKK